MFTANQRKQGLISVTFKKVFTLAENVSLQSLINAALQKTEQ